MKKHRLSIIVGEIRGGSNVASPEASEGNGRRLLRSGKGTRVRAAEREAVLQRQRVGCSHESTNCKRWCKTGSDRLWQINQEVEK